MLQKLVFTLLAIAIVWFGFKYWNRMIAQRPGDRPRVQGGGGTRKEQRPEAQVFETEKCPVCGSYVTGASAGDCGRPNCPYGG